MIQLARRTRLSRETRSLRGLALRTGSETPKKVTQQDHRLNQPSSSQRVRLIHQDIAMQLTSRRSFQTGMRVMESGRAACVPGWSVRIAVLGLQMCTLVFKLAKVVRGIASAS